MAKHVKGTLPDPQIKTLMKRVPGNGSKSRVFSQIGREII